MEPHVSGWSPIQQQQALLGAAEAVTNKTASPAQLSLINQASTGIAAQAAVSSGLTASYRDEGLRRIDGLPVEIQAGLINKQLQLSDCSWYNVQVVGGLNEIRMFQAVDQSNPGIGNVNNQKLENDYWTLLCGIRLRSGLSTVSPINVRNNGQPDIATVSWQPLDLKIIGGDFEFRANTKPILPKDAALSLFDTAYVGASNVLADQYAAANVPKMLNTPTQNVLTGFYRLSNPKWLRPLSVVDMDVRWPVNATAKTWMRIDLYGVCITPF